MSDKRKKLDWRRVGVVLIVLAALYVTSLGPACWLIEHQILPPETLFKIYDPLVFFSGSSQIGLNIMNWYVSLWSNVTFRD